MSVPELSLMNINHRYYSIETFFKAAGEAGYRNIELWTGSMHLYVDCHEHDSVDKIRDLAAQYGIKIVCVCPEQNNPKPWNVAVRGEAGKKRILSYFKNVIDVAVELGAPQILVTSGWAYLDEPAEDAWARSVAMLRSVCDYADMRGIRGYHRRLLWRACLICSNRASIASSGCVDLWGLVAYAAAPCSLKVCTKGEDYVRTRAFAHEHQPSLLQHRDVF